MGATLAILYLKHTYFIAPLQGMGDTVIPMFSGIAEMIMRISIAFLLPLVMGKDGIYFAETGHGWSAMIFVDCGISEKN